MFHAILFFVLVFKIATYEKYLIQADRKSSKHKTSYQLHNPNPPPKKKKKKNLEETIINFGANFTYQKKKNFGATLGSTDTSFRVPYLCHTGRFML